MPTVSLAEADKLTNDQLRQGIIQTIFETDPLFELMTFLPIAGVAHALVREKTQGDAQYIGVGQTITARNPATFDRISTPLTTLIAQAEVNGLIQASKSNMTDQKTAQVVSKSRALARLFKSGYVRGTGAGNEMRGILSYVDPAQTIHQDTAGVDTDGGVITFEKLDELMDLVRSREGEVDALVATKSVVRQIKARLRSVPGASVTEVLTLPSGRQVLGYCGVPILPNDFLPTDEVRGSQANSCSVLALTIDDGSEDQGVLAITAADAAGIQVDELGKLHDRDETATRLTWYTNLVNPNPKGLARLGGVRA